MKKGIFLQPGRQHDEGHGENSEACTRTTRLMWTDMYWVWALSPERPLGLGANLFLWKSAPRRTEQWLPRLLFFYASTKRLIYTGREMKGGWALGLRRDRIKLLSSHTSMVLLKNVSVLLTACPQLSVSCRTALWSHFEKQLLVLTTRLVILMVK